MCLSTALVVLLTATVLLSGAAHTGGEAEAEASPETVGIIRKSGDEKAGLSQEQVTIAAATTASVVAATRKPQDGSGESEVETDAEVPEEDRAIQALLAQGYISDEIPLSYEEQIYLRAACEEFETDYYIMLALIERETRFQNIPGDGGNSQGFCQIQKKWWSDLMDEIGTSDLTDPKDNFRTGCAIITKLSNKHGTIEDALTAYNTGSPGRSKYASAVLEAADGWRELLCKK